MRNESSKSRHRRAVKQPAAAMRRLNSGYSGEEPINETPQKRRKDLTVWGVFVCAKLFPLWTTQERSLREK